MAEAREYTVLSWSPWEDRENDGAPVRDQHGNYRGSVTFEEDRSEPIDATFKTQPAVGDKKYGVVDLYQTRAGKTRKGFKSAPRPQPGYLGGTPSPQQAGQVAKQEWQPESPEKQDSIARSVALKAAVNYHNTIDRNYPKDVLKTAEEFLAWLQGTPTQEPKEANYDRKVESSGYDKARSQAQQIRERQQDDQAIDTYIQQAESYSEDQVPPEYR